MNLLKKNFCSVINKLRCSNVLSNRKTKQISVEIDLCRIQKLITRPPEVSFSLQNMEIITSTLNYEINYIHNPHV